MAENQSDSATQEKAPIFSDEWVKKTLESKADQADADETPTPQGDEPDAEAAQAGTPEPEAVASNWRDTVIPVGDPDVPERYWGKPAGELLTRGYKELERQFNEDRVERKKLEAKVAAQETLKEFLQATKSQQEPPVPTDPYQAAGIDLEVDSVLNPTKFFPKHDEIVLGKAEQRIEQRFKEYEEKQKQESEKQRHYNVAQQGLAALFTQRGLDKLTPDDRDKRINYVLSESARVNRPNGVEAVFNPDTLLQIHDSIWSPPRAAAATPTPPDPPGAKRPAAMDSSKPTGPASSLKSYEREAGREVVEQLKRMGYDVNEERYMARLASNLKRVRG